MSHAAEPHGTESVVDIIRDAGGRIVGRTRLQKIGYLLEISGVGCGFPFEYRHYGPYSELLAETTKLGVLFGEIEEEERPASWGGTYSIFKVSSSRRGGAANVARMALVREAASADPIALELAATAAFLASGGTSDAWGETARRKPEKIRGNNLIEAKKLYQKLQEIRLPKRLPTLV